jgi:hypothetical protein
VFLDHIRTAVHVSAEQFWLKLIKLPVETYITQILECRLASPRQQRDAGCGLSVYRKLHITDLLSSNGQPVVACVPFCGSVFTESLPSSGSVRHFIIQM